MSDTFSSTSLQAKSTNDFKNNLSCLSLNLAKLTYGATPASTRSSTTHALLLLRSTLHCVSSAATTTTSSSTTTSTAATSSARFRLALST
jgi:hypothetical protein